ncbi:MAG: MATE family efflux transporter, partial [Lachnospiraceae bacterium]|nr:MATE family efflux transporter [Lachnospiraceae bacterium]
MNKQIKKDKADLLHGPLLKPIILFAIPLAASGMLQQLFNAADTAVVGRFAGSEAMAAVGSNASVIHLIIALFTGLSVGANVVTASLIGQDRREKIGDAVHTSVAVALLSGVFLLFLGQILARPILTLMGTPEEVMEHAVLYLKLYFAGMPFVMLYNFTSALLRSMGDSGRPLIALIVAGVINVCLNMILVIVFRMGVAGVAIATVISNVISSGI